MSWYACKVLWGVAASLAGLLLVSGRMGLGQEPLRISADTKLDPNQTYGRLVVEASDITIDGQGAWLLGNDALPNQRSGIAIEATGVRRVTLKNIRARGWETALHLVDCSHWTIEDCDFSDNFHDPEFGWGENGRRGGIVLESTSQTKIRRNKANRVWDACVLVNSHDNQIEHNDFSHASNTCLKLWQASGNTIRDNNFSYGIRKKADEVHARDSTGVLIESGSNNNRFIHNDCTYGGDGIFIRVLNRWCSTGNYFESNDCSYANNNGFECWAPRNTFVRNKANHCSYGFWLGGSDQTVLQENEASYNGLPAGNHNSPHLPDQGHAGIVFMFGPSSHVMAHANRCEHNNGAGIALIGDIPSQGAKWKAYHWLITENHLHSNRWGLFAQYADWIRLERNHLSQNSQADIESSRSVSRLFISPDTKNQQAQPSQHTTILDVIAPAQATSGHPLRFSIDHLNNPTAQVEWDFGDQTGSGQHVQRSFDQAGFYRIGVTATSDLAPSQIGWLDFYVTDSVEELATDPTAWSCQPADGLKCTYQRDQVHHVAGSDSIAAIIDPYHGQIAWLSCTLTQPQDSPKTKDKSELVLWLKSINPNLPGWQSNNPEIIVIGPNHQQLKLKPKHDLFSQPAYNEARDGWQMIVIPLKESDQWLREGELPDTIEKLSIGVDSWDSGPLQLWIDGLILR